MKTLKIDFISPRAKQNAINQIFIIKRGIRQYGELIKLSGLYQRQRERKYAEIKNQPFQKVRAANLQQRIESMKEHHKSLCEKRKLYYNLLADWIIHFDSFNSSLHEKAQLLGVSHVYLKRMVNDLDLKDERLFSLAAIGAEDYFDKGAYAGATEARETPLKFAALFQMMGALKESPKFRDDVFNIMHKTFGPIPMYRQSVNREGETVMDRLPPKLTIVGNGGDHE